MYQRIFVPIDDSDTAHAALTEAIRLAVDQHAVIRLSHVVDLAQFAWGGAALIDTSELQQDLLRIGNAVVAGFAQRVSEAGVAYDCEVHQTFGERIARVIVEDAKAWQADLIVMGTHGRRGFDHLLMGSVAEGVMRMTPTPLLMIRAE